MCRILPSPTDSDTSADQRQHVRKPAPHHHFACRTRGRYRLTDGGLLGSQVSALIQRWTRRSSSSCDNLRKTMTAFLSLDDTTPPSGFVHLMAGRTAVL